MCRRARKHTTHVHVHTPHHLTSMTALHVDELTHTERARARVHIPPPDLHDGVACGRTGAVHGRDGEALLLGRFLHVWVRVV